MRSALRWFGLALLGAVAAVPPLAAGPAEKAAVPRPLVHPERGVAERESIAVVHALIRDDLAAAKTAMGLLKAAVRALPAEELDQQGSDVLVHSQAFHAALNRARESVGAGLTLRAFDDFYWAQRSCRQCHDAARERGVAIGEPSAAPTPAP